MRQQAARRLWGHAQRRWDLRPDRTVSLLASLATFLAASEEGREEDDLDRLQATAPDLGAIGGQWILAKRSIREMMQAQVYGGILRVDRRHSRLKRNAA